MTSQPLDHTAEYWLAREQCAYFPIADLELIRIRGKDALTFLQTQVTNDVLKLADGEGQENAVVDRKARLRATFSLYRESDAAALLLVERAQKTTLIESLEEHHFREDFQFDHNLEWDHLLAVQGPKSPILLERLTGEVYSLLKPNSFRQITIGHTPALVFIRNLTGDDGFMLAYGGGHSGEILRRVREAGAEYGINGISAETQEVLRVEAGLPRFGRDMDSRHILPETGLEHTAVSYHKGCYTGQEVIARIKTYGAPAFALMGLIWEDRSLPPRDADLKISGRKVGTVKSSVFSPALQAVVSLAYLQKEFRSPDQQHAVSVDGATHRVKTALLPFYQPASRSERARELHREALDLFRNEQDLEAPIARLREAIALDPKFSAGYEALGVMLSKQNKLDEAIALMKRLTEIDPQEIMAHTNLSIYYMQQGRIEDAELEKAEATAIQFEKMVEESQAKKAREEKARVAAAERQRQIAMFREVLEIDPVDQVANFGLGSVFLEQGQYAEAVPPLECVVANYPDHSAAYLALGRARQGLGENGKAVETYRRGIAAASKKGDLMPLRDMQTRLNQLLQEGS